MSSPVRRPRLSTRPSKAVLSLSRSNRCHTLRRASPYRHWRPVVDRARLATVMIACDHASLRTHGHSVPAVDTGTQVPSVLLGGGPRHAPTGWALREHTPSERLRSTTYSRPPVPRSSSVALVVRQRRLVQRTADTPSARDRQRVQALDGHRRRGRRPRFDPGCNVLVPSGVITIGPKFVAMSPEERFRPDWSVPCALPAIRLFYLPIVPLPMRILLHQASSPLQR